MPANVEGNEEPEGHGEGQSPLARRVVSVAASESAVGSLSASISPSEAKQVSVGATLPGRDETR